MCGRNLSRSVAPVGVTPLGVAVDRLPVQPAPLARQASRQQRGWRGRAGARYRPAVGELDALLRDQAAYYRAVAGEYDRAYESQEDLRSLNELAEGLPITGDVLELACGTGQWTRFLAARDHRVTAVDAAPEMLAMAQERVAGLVVEFVEADLFTWRTPRQFDTCSSPSGYLMSHRRSSPRSGGSSKAHYGPEVGPAS